MNLLATTILENASWWQNYWLNNSCKTLVKKDSVSGRGSCVDTLKKQYATGAEKEGTPWCAQFVSVVVKTSFEKLKLPKSKLPYTASTLAMLDGAKKAGLRVDKTPVEGCIFFRYRNGGGHVGIVVKVTSDTLYTIEGNSDNAVVARQYKKSSTESYQYIHVQDEYQPTIFNYALRNTKLPLYAAGAITTAGIGYLGYKRWKKKRGLADEIMQQKIQEIKNILVEHGTDSII